jgi:nucleoside-diphosphate-sugar epimerase
MLGRKLVDALVREGALGERAIEQLVLVDVVEPAVPTAAFTVEARCGDLADPGVASSLAAGRPDVVFHLAAVVSGEAEADIDKGYRANLDGTRLLLDALRAEQNAEYVPRVVFSSSIAVFGAPFPDVIGDDEQLTPLTSYGTQKAMAELLLADCSRRGFVDGIALRLPTICVRPGTPNLAASGFFSSIIREPLNGHEAVLPVTDDVRHWFASPRAAIGFFVHAATLDTGPLGHRRALTMPGVSATVAEQLASLRRFGGAQAERLVRRQPDETIARIVAGWPAAFDTRRAATLGFVAERTFDEIVRVYIDDELGGPVPDPSG